MPAETLLEAYAACGGYPLHLRRWRPDLSTEENLGELAFTPGGLLLRDAPDILSEDLDWRGGYDRVLTAMAGRSADPMYEIADTCLAYWFAVLRDDADLIEGG